MYALIGTDGFIVRLSKNKESDSFVHVDEETMNAIRNDPDGHLFFRYVNGSFIRDDSIKVQTWSDKDRPILYSSVSPHEIGVFGNVWVRKLYFPTKDTVYEGHKHDHDHVSLLMSGSVLVEVEGYEPKEFKAPTYIIIRAEHEHKVTALEDNTLWWCIHAIRDESGEVVDVYGDENDPLAGRR